MSFCIVDSKVKVYTRPIQDTFRPNKQNENVSQPKTPDLPRLTPPPQPVEFKPVPVLETPPPLQPPVPTIFQNIPEVQVEKRKPFQLKSRERFQQRRREILQNRVQLPPKSEPEPISEPPPPPAPPVEEKPQPVRIPEVQIPTFLKTEKDEDQDEFGYSIDDL
jgi:hypothetical protein